MAKVLWRTKTLWHLRYYLGKCLMEDYRRLYWLKLLRVLVDTVLVSGAFYGAYLIRFDFDVWTEYQIQAIKLLPVVVIIRITALYFVGGYRGLMKYTSLDDLVRLLKGVLIGSVLLVGINYFRNYPLSMAVAFDVRRFSSDPSQFKYLEGV